MGYTGHCAPDRFLDRPPYLIKEACPVCAGTAIVNLIRVSQVEDCDKQKFYLCGACEPFVGGRNIPYDESSCVPWWQFVLVLFEIWHIRSKLQLEVGSCCVLW
jgi:hypothetical protein